MKLHAVAGPEQQRGNTHDGCHFYGRSHVLQIGAAPGSENVHGCDHGDHRKRHELCRPGPKSDKFSQVVAESNRESSDRTCADDEEENPAKQKCGKPSEAVSNINIQTTGGRVHRAQFPISKSAEQRKDPAEKPNGQCH